MEQTKHCFDSIRASTKLLELMKPRNRNQSFENCQGRTFKPGYRFPSMQHYMRTFGDPTARSRPRSLYRVPNPVIFTSILLTLTMLHYFLKTSPPSELPPFVPNLQTPPSQTSTRRPYHRTPQTPLSPQTSIQSHNRHSVPHESCRDTLRQPRNSRRAAAG
jgi:hypothetical protein